MKQSSELVQKMQQQTVKGHEVLSYGFRITNQSLLVNHPESILDNIRIGRQQEPGLLTHIGATVTHSFNKLFNVRGHNRITTRRIGMADLYDENGTLLSQDEWVISPRRSYDTQHLATREFDRNRIEARAVQKQQKTPSDLDI